MKIQYILHADFELPGIIETWAAGNQFIQNFCRPFAKEQVPVTADYDLLVVMGGPQSPLQLDEAPYLADEITLIQKTLQMEIPVLGICLGAQLLGEALGARTEKSPHKEAGVFPVTLTAEGLQDPLLAGLPESFSVVHWHNDMPGLTKNAKVLATSEGCPRQIIRYTPLAYGFQCHPEPARQNIEAMIEHCPDDLKPGLFVQSPQEFLAHDFEAINRRMIQIMDRLIFLKTKC